MSSACIPPDPDPNAISVSDNGGFTLVMNEFSFSPSSIQLDAGSTVTIRLVNEGAVEHELMVGRTVMPGGGYGEDLLAVMLADGDPSPVLESALTAAGSTTTTASTTDAGHDETNSDSHHDGESTTTDPTAPAVTTEDGDHHGDEPEGGDHHGDEPGSGDQHGGDGANHGGSHITVQPGESTEIVLRVPAGVTGEWQIGCFIEGHFEAGMLGSMTIRQPSA